MDWILLGYVALTILAIIFLIIIWFYRKVSPQEVLVRSGWGGLKLIQNQGAICFPIFHECQRISLKSFSLKLELSEKDMLYSQDQQQFSIEFSLYVRIENLPQAIIKAIMISPINEENLSAFLRQQICSAAHNISANQTFKQIDTQRENFSTLLAENIQTLLLNEYGIKLESIAISQLNWIKSSLYHQSLRPEGISIQDLWNSLTSSLMNY